MKLLQTFYSIQDARQVAEQLKLEGIPTFISNEDLKNLDPAGGLTGVIKVGLWVMIDNQYDDAKMLLQDPNHKVCYQLTPEEITFLENQKEKSYPNFINKTFNIIASSLLGALIIGLIIYILYHNL